MIAKFTRLVYAGGAWQAEFLPEDMGAKPVRLTADEIWYADLPPDEMQRARDAFWLQFKARTYAEQAKEGGRR